MPNINYKYLERLIEITKTFQAFFQLTTNCHVQILSQNKASKRSSKSQGGEEKKKRGDGPELEYWNDDVQKSIPFHADYPVNLHKSLWPAFSLTNFKHLNESHIKKCHQPYK